MKNLLFLYNYGIGRFDGRLISNLIRSASTIGFEETLRKCYPFTSLRRLTNLLTLPKPDHFNPEELTEIKLEDLLKQWVPGSHEWSWEEEYEDLIKHQDTVLLESEILSRGFNFANASEPIMLGPDGRVWDGHHRIVLAMKHTVETLTVVIFKNEGDSND